MRKLMASIFAAATRCLAGTGIGRFSLVQKVYRFLYRFLISKSTPLPPLLVSVQGHKMYVGATTVDFGPSWARSSSYEKYETELFRKVIKQGMVVVDIGASIGYYTLIAAKIVGGHGRVYAFEPAPESYALLKKNIETNGYTNVSPVQKAISNKVGTSRLFLAPDGNAGFNRTYDTKDGWDSIEIETITLDEFLKDKEDRVDVIKMDVEGAEAAALQGMAQTLKRNDNLKIFTEFSPTFLERSGSSPEEYLSQLMEHGFKIYGIDERTEQIGAINRDSFERFRSQWRFANLLCVKGENKELARLLSS